MRRTVEKRETGENWKSGRLRKEARGERLGARGGREGDGRRRKLGDVENLGD